MLEKIRGTKDVDEEYQDILEKAQLAAMVKNPWTLLLFRKKYRRGPHLHRPHCCPSRAAQYVLAAHSPLLCCYLMCPGGDCAGASRRPTTSAAFCGARRTPPRGGGGGGLQACGASLALAQLT